MARRIRGVAFDLEGPLINVEQPHFDGFMAVAKELGIGKLFKDAHPLSFERVIPGSIGGGDAFNIKEMLKLAGEEPTEERAEALRINVKMRAYNEALDALVVKARDGAEAFVEFVRDELELPVAIASLTPRAQAQALFEQSGVDKWFPNEAIVLLEDVRNKKPAPDVYLETAHRMGIDPSEQLAFEDSGTGVRAAVAARSPVIGLPVFATPSYTEKLTNLGAMRVFGEWDNPELYELVKKLVA